MVQGSYVFLLMPGGLRADAIRRVHQLSGQGCTVRPCRDLQALINQIVQSHATHARAVTVIDGRGPDGAAAVSAVRALSSTVGIVVTLERDDDASMTNLLKKGADVCSYPCASPDLWLAKITSLLWRVGLCPPETNFTSETSGRWLLIKRGWAIRAPGGQIVSLTTGERAFLTTLLNAPHQQATHDELIAAVNAAYNYSTGHTHQSRLGVMVSRMRSKFKKAGVPLPLKSRHNWGYMFVDR